MSSDTLDNNSPGLRDTLLRDWMSRRYDTEDAAPEDEDEVQRLLSKMVYRYKTGDSVMIRSEEEVHRWLLVKIVKSYGWWVLGGYIPIYVISFGSGALQNCQEDEIWPVYQILNMRETRDDTPKKDSYRSSSRAHPADDDNDDNDEALELELERKLKEWRKLTGNLINPSGSDIQEAEVCSCAEEHCVHSTSTAPLEDGEIVEEAWEDVF